MSKAKQIAISLCSGNWEQIERAFATYHPDLEKEVIAALEEQEPELKKIDLSNKIPQYIALSFDCDDEYYLEGFIVVDGLDIKGVKIEYSYGSVNWNIDTTSKYELSGVLSTIKGNCWDGNAGGDIEVSKPGNDVYKFFQEDSKVIFDAYDLPANVNISAWNELEALYSYQYLDGLESKHLHRPHLPSCH